MMTSSKRFLPCFILVVMILLCVFTFSLMTYSLFFIQREVEQTFGKAPAHLDPPQKLRFQVLLYVHRKTLLTPLNPNAPLQSFTISPNEPTQRILQRLAEEGIISDPQALQIFMQYQNYDTQIQSGEHLLSPAMSPQQIAQALIDPANLLIQFNLLAGWRNEEVAAALAASGLSFSAQAFLDAADQPLELFLPQRIPKASIRNLQGFLMPATYRLLKNASPEELLSLFTQNFNTQVTTELEQKFQEQGLSLYEGIILASIVQRESMLEEEMPLIASVFLNRLRAQMKLDSDATVQYALGYNEAQKTWWTNPLSTADFSIDSPYNTYRYAGLPPTPICNPGLTAIRAVAEAPQTDYFYFRAACDGSGRHLFANTYAEHLENACP
jgi:UPF0755 protein